MNDILDKDLDVIRDLSKVVEDVKKKDDFYEFSEDYLAHFGILGMKWGKKNGPPYPLDRMISTGRRLRQQRREKKEAESRERDGENAKSLLKHRRKYSTAELRDKINRIRAIDEIKELSMKRKNKLKRGIDFINGYTKSFGTGVGNVSKIIQNLDKLSKLVKDKQDSLKGKSKNDNKNNKNINNNKNNKVSSKEKELERRIDELMEEIEELKEKQDD